MSNDDEHGLQREPSFMHRSLFQADLLEDVCRPASLSRVFANARGLILMNESQERLIRSKADCFLIKIEAASERDDNLIHSDKYTDQLRSFDEKCMF